MSTAFPRYPALVRAVHWLSALLVLVAYLTSDLMDDAGEHGGGGTNWHVLAGLLLLALFVPRLLGYTMKRPRMPPVAGSAAERIAAGALHVALLLFVVVQPLIGLASLWADGQTVAVPLTAWTLPSLLPIEPALARDLEELHEALGTVFYGVIGLHAAAALWHHVVRRDGVLRRML
ncbi:cytochrome b [Lysobacter xanthus]